MTTFPMANSTTAHNGSSKSAKERAEPQQQEHGSKYLVEEFIKDGRDVRAYVVPEYDVHQEEAKKKHRQDLDGILKRKY